ncbi:MAG: MlaD family protein [Planctomycetota bacterium]
MSDYDSIQKKHNLVVGIFTLVGIVALGWMIFLFGDLPVAVSRIRSFQVYVQFPSAPGIQENTPVQFCGYQVGRVVAVIAPKVIADRETGRVYHHVKAVLAIDKEYVDIPANIQVKLIKRGLGSSYIELLPRHGSVYPPEPLDSNRPETAFLCRGMVLEGSTGASTEFLPEETQQQLEELAKNLTDLSSDAEKVLGDEENQDNFKKLLAKSVVALEEIRRFSAAGVETLTIANKSIEEISASLVATNSDMSIVARELRVTIEKLNSGQGSAGKFLNDGRLYENLLDSTEELEMMAKRMNELLVQWQREGMKFKHF